ncbi:MAG: alanine--tRNA ligase-related protein, partial [Bacillota bacterium]|nr:alanine--tRNA ligase-related protein [Bacillota bacterium]
GEEMFRLYDTYGFPLDLLQDAAREEGLSLDLEGFEVAMAEQRRRAREDRQKKLQEARFGWPDDLPPTRFLGYERLEATFEVLAVEEDEEGAWVILDQTPFYPEGGGQVGDRGVLRVEGREIAVGDTQRQGAWILHRVGEKGALQPGMEGAARVDEGRRRATMRNHTATHLLHSALRRRLGPQTHQKGSLVAPDRLRFDFTALRPLTREDLQAIEEEVNRWILEDLPVTVAEMEREEALSKGALAFFEEKYGERVRVVGVGSVSLELCGGTHVARSAEIGLFHILGESGVGTGIRRIEAVTAGGLLADLLKKEAVLEALSRKVRAPWEDLPQRLDQLEAEKERLEAALEAYESLVRRQERDRLLAERDGSFVVGETSLQDPEQLRMLAEELRQRLPEGGALLGSIASGRVLLVAALSPEAVKGGLHAGKLLAEVAREVGGGGGGRPDFAQAGGKDPQALPKALQKARERLHARSPKP